MCTREIKDNPYGYRSPSDQKLLHKEVRIKTKDGYTLYGWFVYLSENTSEVKRAATYIYFHENAGNIGFRIPFITYLLKKIGVNVLVVGYRGYGYSEGEPSEEGIMLDSEAVIDYMLKEENEITTMIDQSNVYIFGRSLGGAVAIYIAEKLKPQVKGIILENTFSSMGDMVDHLFPFLKRFKNFLLRNKWPSNERIKNLDYPILFISSEKDELVPCKHMDHLFNISTKSKFKHKYVILGGTHNDSWQRVIGDYTKEINNFMAKCDEFENEKEIEKLVEVSPSINDLSSINEVEDDSYLIKKEF
jgi:fermentation-respiration switch protein FrsA (DUF1100 family)